MIGVLCLVKSFILFVLNLLLLEARLSAFNSPSCPVCIFIISEKFVFVFTEVEGIYVVTSGVPDEPKVTQIGLLS